MIVLPTTQRRLLDWLAEVVAGRPAPIEIDSDMAHLLRVTRLSELAALHSRGNDGVLRDSFVRSAAIERESRRCLGLLAGADVPAVTLKGPALAARFWGDAAARVSMDIDLIVAPVHIRPALVALEAAGFAPAGVFPGWYEPRWHYHAVLSDPSSIRPSLELHWGIARPGLARADIAAIVAGGEAVPCLFGDLPAPTPSWQLLIAALHATRHLYPPRELLDVAFIARALGDREWSIAVREARRAAVGPSLYYSLSLVEDRFGLRFHRLIRELRPSRARDAIVGRYLAGLPVTGGAGKAMLRLGKAVTPLSSSSLSRLPAGLAWSLSDHPHLAGWLDRTLRRRASGAGRT